MATLTLQQAFALAAQHQQAGHWPQAEEIYRQILAQNPDLPAAHYHLGFVLKQTGQLDAAIAAYRQAIALQPNYSDAYNELGIALRTKGQLDDALAAFNQAIAFKPTSPAAYANLGNALRDKGQLDSAIAAYRKAIAFQPNLFEAHNNLGTALKDNGQLDAAIDSFRRSIALNPNYAEAHSNLGNALKEMGQLDEAIAAYRHSIALKPNSPDMHGNLLNILYFHPGYDAESIRREHLLWNQQHAEPLRHFIEPHSNDRSPDRRLKIGYVSPDFCFHPVGRFLLPLFAHHNHKLFEITAYASVRVEDAMTRQLRQHANVWRNITGLSNAQAAQLIRADGIDILIDLSLHTAHNRLLLFARKPAPVQATWLGYVGTTGLPTMDYRLSDPYLDPPGQDETVYVEKTLRVPHSFWCYEAPQFAPPVNDLPAAAGPITFGCFNKFSKVTPHALDLWAALMRQIPGSQLVLHSKPGSHEQQVRHRFAAAGVGPERLRFAGSQPMKNYFAQYGQIDIALDPFPFGGGTTTCDALWMGVPVVTLAGRTAASRAGLSLLSNVGLTQWIARTPEEYLAIARHWAADLPTLAQLRRELRAMMLRSPLMNASQFAADMEAAYRLMWAKWCKTGS